MPCATGQTLGIGVFIGRRPLEDQNRIPRLLPIIKEVGEIVSQLILNSYSGTDLQACMHAHGGTGHARKATQKPVDSYEEQNGHREVS